jgi:Fe-S-cluster containining protein
MVRVSPAEVAAIAAHLGLGLAGFRSRYLTPSGDRLREGLGGRCVFLEDGAVAGCGIYPVRPEKCRSWPFWPELAASPTARAEAMRLCPGLEPAAADPGPR